MQSSPNPEDQTRNSDSVEIIRGLQAKNKHISSRFLYDAEGSELFRQIMKMPEYYLYEAEYEILRDRGGDIHRALPFQKPYSVVEFGAGDGSKVTELMKHLAKSPLCTRYCPVDISAEATRMIRSRLKTSLPELKVEAVTGNYFENMPALIPQEEAVLLLFMGSNIGNFSSEKILGLMKKFGESLQSGDALLIGFDLKKHPGTIRRAYDDRAGITRAFNLNLLKRFNRELGTDFHPDQFDFYSCYHPESGEVRSYLVSLCRQEVRFPEANEKIIFQKNEPIHTEISKKFDFIEIETLVSSAGFTILDHWTDQREYYTDVLCVR